MNHFISTARRPIAAYAAYYRWFALSFVLLVLLCVPAAYAQINLIDSPYPAPVVPIGSGVDLTYTFELSEPESVYLVQVDPGFTDYSIKDTSGCPIDPTGRTNSMSGATCTIIVHFAPSVPGLRNAPLRVMSTAANFATPLIGYGDGPQGVIYPGGDSVFLGIFGMPGFNGDNNTEYKQLNAPSAIAFDSGSRLYFADQGNFRIRRIQFAGALETVVGNGTAGFSGDGGPSTSAKIGATISGIALDSAQNMFIVDQANFRIRKIGTYLSGFAAPTINTIIGNGTQASSDGCATLGPPNTPSFNTLYGVAVDQFENVYFSDAGTGCIYRLQEQGDERGNITRIGGTGTQTSTGDGGMATSATFIQPGALALDAQQVNLYVIDMGDYQDSNGVHHGKNIRMINLNTGVVTAVAGNGASFNISAGDGGLATAANFNEPSGLVLDAANNLYITESEHVRRIDAATGTITNVVGDTAIKGLSEVGRGGLQYAIAPTGIALDNQGSYYLLEPSEAVIEKIDLSMPYLEFNSTNIGSTSIDSPESLYLSNIGTQPLTVSRPAPVLTSSNFIVSTTSPVTRYVPCDTETQSTTEFTLAAGATCASMVSFIPSVLDSNIETATFTDNSLNTAGGIAQDMGLHAESYGDLSSGTLLPSPEDYGQIAIGSSSTKSITFTNNGTSGLTFFGATVTTSGGLASSVFMQANNCPSILPIGASCVFNVTFAPSATGAQTATLSVNSTIVGGSTALLTGTGTETAAGPQPVLTPATMDFGSLTIGTTSATQTATLRNAGSVPQSISSFGFFGSNTSSFNETNNCGPSLAAGASCSITIACTPSATGSLTANLGANFPSPESQLSIALTCNGTAATAPQATLTPALLSFTTVAGSTPAPQVATLTNRGTATLNISDITLTGANPTDFAISSTTCGATLAPAATCMISVTFTPATAGSFSASISVTDNASSSPQTGALSGTGTALSTAADFTVTATPASQSVTSGSGATYVVAVASTSGVFTQVVGLAASGLPPGATVSFSPASVTPGSSGAQSTMLIRTEVQQASQKNSLPQWPLAAPLYAVLLFLLPCKRFWFRKKGRELFVNLVCIIVLLGIALSTVGCGGGFALPSSAKTYTITVSGTSGSNIHSTTVTLTVQ